MVTIDPARALDVITIRLYDYADAYITRIKKLSDISDMEIDEPYESATLVRAREDFESMCKHIAGYCEGVDDMLSRFHGCTHKLWHQEVVENLRQWEKDLLSDRGDDVLRAKIAEALFTYDEDA